MVQLRAGFHPDPQVARGRAGGPLEARTFAPNDYECRGWLPRTPQHTLILQTRFENLRILVNGREDTTLVIRGPDGRHRCSDDAEGIHPIVGMPFESGRYEVWVGTYDPETTASYVIGFSELEHITPAALENR